jgi:glycopeptide antibiotics resistance protein
MEYPTVIGRGWALLVLVAFPFVASAMRPRGARRVALVGALFLYAAAVVAVTIFPIYVPPESWRAGEHWWDVLRLVPFVVPPIGFALNIVMFVPFGILLPLIWPATGRLGRIAWWALIVSAVIEFSQLGMWIALGNRRMFDVNDLMSNTAGALLGLSLLRVVRPRPGAPYPQVSLDSRRAVEAGPGGSPAAKQNERGHGA